jgi:hypothetical protein
MTLPLSPPVIRAAYDFLNETLPFRRWNLPDSEDVVFKVAKDRNCHGWINTGRKFKKPEIEVSRVHNGHTLTLLMTVAHEMVHLHQYLTKMPQSHGKNFKALAAQVCRYHGFDPKLF